MKQAALNKADDQAFAAHAALLRAERDHSTLRSNPFWTMLRQDAYERFCLEFERAGNE